MLQLSTLSENLLVNGSKRKPRDIALFLHLSQELVKSSTSQEESLNKAFRILQNQVILLINNSWKWYI